MSSCGCWNGTRPLSIAEVAIVLGISRPAVIEMAGNMEEAGLIAGDPVLFAEPSGFD